MVISIKKWTLFGLHIQKKQKRVACLHIHQALSSPIKKENKEKKKKEALPNTVIDTKSTAIFFIEQASYKYVGVKPTYSRLHACDKHAP